MSGHPRDMNALQARWAEQVAGHLAACNRAIRQAMQILQEMGDDARDQRGAGVVWLRVSAATRKT